MKAQRNAQVRDFHCFPGGKTDPVATAIYYSIILVDDHAKFRREIKKIIEGALDLKVVGEAGDGSELLDLLKEITPDLVILDISMPKCGGLEASREIKRLYPGIKVMILTMHHDPEYIQCALGIGIDGYLQKEAAADELIKAILTLKEGKTCFPALCSKYVPSEPSGRITLAWEIA